MITLKLKKNNREIVIVDNAGMVMKNQFYEKLTQVLVNVNSRKEILVLGDLNAKTGKSSNSEVVGRFEEDKQ